MVEVNQEVEKIKEEISTIQETVNAMRETVQEGKTKATDSKTKLEELESELSSLKNDALEISNLNHYNKQKIIKINSELRETNELFKVEEKIEKKILDFGTISIYFIVIPFVMFYVCLVGIFAVNKLQANDSLKFMLLALLVALFWGVVFWLIKKILLKKEYLILKKNLNKAYAFATCAMLIISLGFFYFNNNNENQYTVKLTENSTKESIKDSTIYAVEKYDEAMKNEDFIGIMTIFFALMPSVLIRPIIFDDERLVIENIS